VAVKSLTRDVLVTADNRMGCVDLTDELRRTVKDTGVVDGCCVVFCAHTTCALILNEWEEGVLEDLKSRLEALVPSDDYYAHDDLSVRTENLVEGEERRNGPAHVAGMIVGGTSHAIPVAGGEPLLGRWQRLFLLELDEPKERTIVFHAFGLDGTA
jgi:secondary thiamine-phosphate synthase enzyme